MHDEAIAQTAPQLVVCNREVAGVRTDALSLGAPHKGAALIHIHKDRHVELPTKGLDVDRVPVGVLDVEELACGVVHHNEGVVIAKANDRTLEALGNRLDDLAVAVATQRTEGHPVQVANADDVDHDAAVRGSVDITRHVQDVDDNDGEEGGENGEVRRTIHRRCVDELGDQERCSGKDYGVVEDEMVVEQRQQHPRETRCDTKVRKVHGDVDHHDRLEDIEAEEQRVDEDENAKDHREGLEAAAVPSKQLARIAEGREHNHVESDEVEGIDDAEKRLVVGGKLTQRQNRSCTHAYAQHRHRLRQHALPLEGEEREGEADKGSDDEQAPYNRQCHMRLSML